jgi:hypothetical protein
MSTSALQNPIPQPPSSHSSGLFDPRGLLAFTLCSVGALLATFSFAANPTPAGWAIVALPNANTNPLGSVACASTNDCWAIGGSNIAMHWNGISWTTVAMPTVNNAVLKSVACASSSECWAVGYYNNGSVPQTLIERWDGNSWSIVASLNNGANGSELYGVTCTSVSDCWAVGYNPGHLFQTLIERWNGTSWVIVNSPNHSNAGSAVYSVACASASDCWAVGNWNDGDTGDSLIEHWDGNSWSIAASPYTGIAYNSVACASASECWAVTGSGLEFGPPLLIARWNGTTWAVVSTPAPSPDPDNTHALYTVTCASASECWAVGYYSNGTAARTLIEQWDGASWSIVASPNNGTGTQANYLYGVTCASASQCWAVGSSSAGTLIEVYTPAFPPLTGVVSRMTHGSGAGTFDINLPLIGTRGVECRSSAFLGAGNYTMIFSFVNNVTSCGSASIGSLSSGPSLNQCTVNLTGVANAQYTTVTLNNVLDVQNNTGNVSATMGALVGDVNGNGVVSNTDVSLVKAQVAAPVGVSNFRNDVNATGVISNTDVSLTKAQVGATLPTAP